MSGPSSLDDHDPAGIHPDCVPILERLARECDLMFRHMIEPPYDGPTIDPPKAGVRYHVQVGDNESDFYLSYFGVLVRVYGEGDNHIVFCFGGDLGETGCVIVTGLPMLLPVNWEVTEDNDRDWAMAATSWQPTVAASPQPAEASQPPPGT
jgi:hypothetical protein